MKNIAVIIVVTLIFTIIFVITYNVKKRENLTSQIIAEVNGCLKKKNSKEHEILMDSICRAIFPDSADCRNFVYKEITATNVFFLNPKNVIVTIEVIIEKTVKIDNSNATIIINGNNSKILPTKNNCPTSKYSETITISSKKFYNTPQSVKTMSLISDTVFIGNQQLFYCDYYYVDQLWSLKNKKWTFAEDSHFVNKNNHRINMSKSTKYENRYSK